MASKSPDAFRTISEVADWLQTPAHVLRFWESKFSQVKPVKRAGGRRYYRPADMALIGGIKKLLHDDGMTIKGVQKVLREQGIKHVSALSPPLEEDLESMIEPTLSATPAPGQPAAQDTGQVLDFTNRASEDLSKDAASKPEDREPEPAAAGDLFDEDDDPSENLFAEQGDGSEAQDSESEAESTQAHDDLPEFVQKPMSERLAEDEAEAAATEEAEVAPPEEPAPPADEDAKAAEEAATPQPAPEAPAEDDDAPRPGQIETPPDPADHEIAALTGPLTLLTTAEMRAHRHSAERIETLIIRVRNHHRTLAHAARN